jgi:hypothetical protein
MPPRPLDLLDLPSLYRFRDSAVALDTARMLTRGNPLGAAGFMSYLNPGRHIYSAITQDNGVTLLGGITQSNGDTFAKLYYLAPASQLTHPGLPALIELLATEAGHWGAFHVLAEVDENSSAFAALRMSGFSVYAWQRTWDVSQITPRPAPNDWLRMRAEKLPAVQTLYHQIVPPLLQPIEPMPKRAVGLVCSDCLQCYVSVSYGVHGIMLTPFIHPEATGVAEKLTSLLHHLPDRRNRPVYLCVRSYQAWLEPVLEDLGAKSSQRQAVMVKHLASAIRDARLARATQPSVVAQASHIRRNDENSGR